MINVLTDEGEPSSYNGTLLEKQPVNNNKTCNSDYVEASSEDSISEDDISVPTAPGTLPYCFVLVFYILLLGKSRGVRHRWTQLEVQNLLDGVGKFGVGNWSNIYINYYFLPCRDPVSLKDKWRNMIKNKEVPKKYLRN